MQVNKGGIAIRSKVLLILAILVTTALLVGGADLSFAEEAAPGTLAVAQTLETTFWLNNGGSGSDVLTLYPDGTVVTAVGSSGYWFQPAPDRLLMAFPPGTAYWQRVGGQPT